MLYVTQFFMNFVYFTSITGQFLVFCLEGLAIKISKSTRDDLLLTFLVLTDVSISQIIGEEFFLLLSSVSVKPSLNDAVLI